MVETGRWICAEFLRWGGVTVGAAVAGVAAGA